MPGTREPFWTVIKRLVGACGLFLAHLLVGTVAVAGLAGSEKVFSFFFHDGSPKLFGVCPLKWLFDAGDGGILLVLVIAGVLEMWTQLRR